MWPSGHVNLSPDNSKNNFLSEEVFAGPWNVAIDLADYVSAIWRHISHMIVWVAKAEGGEESA